jgi:hypothetical protein
LKEKITKPIKEKLTKMYHSKIKTQEPKKENLNLPTKQLVENTTCNEIQHPGKLRGYGNKILQYLFIFKNKPGREIANAKLADYAGCDLRTVRRWTSKFVSMGIITKKRQDIFTFNQYYVSPRVSKKFGYTMWRQTCTPEQLFLSQYKVEIAQEHANREYYIQNSEQIEYQKFFHPETVLPLNINIYINTRIPVTRAHAYTRPEEAQPEKNEVNRNRKSLRVEKSRKEARVVRRLMMLKDNQKQWIIEKALVSDESKAKARKSLWDNSDVKKTIITPKREELAKLLSLDERELLKLTAFPDEAIAWTLVTIQKMLKHPETLQPVLDRMGWVISFCMKWCNLNKVEPEWRWYYALCEITGIAKVNVGESPKPLIVPGAPPYPPQPGREFSWDNITDAIEDQPKYDQPKTSQSYNSAYAKKTNRSQGPSSDDLERRRRTQENLEAFNKAACERQRAISRQKNAEWIAQKEKEGICQKDLDLYLMKLLGLPSPGTEPNSTETESSTDKRNKKYSQDSLLGSNTRANPYSLDL